MGLCEVRIMCAPFVIFRLVLFSFSSPAFFFRDKSMLLILSLSLCLSVFLPSHICLLCCIIAVVCQRSIIYSVFGLDLVE